MKQRLILSLGLHSVIVTPCHPQEQMLETCDSVMMRPQWNFERWRDEDVVRTTLRARSMGGDSHVKDIILFSMCSEHWSVHLQLL